MRSDAEYIVRHTPVREGPPARARPTLDSPCECSCSPWRARTARVPRKRAPLRHRSATCSSERTAPRQATALLETLRSRQKPLAPGRLRVAPLEEQLTGPPAPRSSPALRRLLTALGDLAAPNTLPASDDRLLDPQLVEALERFQRRHGLDTDRAAGPRATFTALTTPLEQRVRQIEIKLERWRWLPPFQTPPIIVNIPQFRLFAFKSTEDRAVSIPQMPVIVKGRSRFRTQDSQAIACEGLSVSGRTYASRRRLGVAERQDGIPFLIRARCEPARCPRAHP